MECLRKIINGGNSLQNIIIYGGSFDPPHNGHIKTANTLQQKLHFDRFIFLPCKTPLLKDMPSTTPLQRVEMLKLALRPYPALEIDLREIERSGPSYTVDTLEEFRAQYGDEISITILIGMDAFLQLPDWHCAEKLITLANILVMQRHKFNNKDVAQFTHEPTALLKSRSGKIAHINVGEYDISSSDLRKKINSGLNVNAYLAPDVYKYIQIQKLYGFI